MSATTKVSRLIRAPREAIYRACVDPHVLAQWRMPQDMTARVESVDGAAYRMSLGYGDGRADTFAATFVERVPQERIVERIRFDAPDRAGEMVMTTTLRTVEGGGTEVSVLCENLPPGIRPEDNEEGSRQALERLARRVEG